VTLALTSVAGAARRVRSLPWIGDAVLAALIVVAGAWAGGTYRNVFIASGAASEFAQHELGASIALACGHGFTNPAASKTPLNPRLTAFLARTGESVTCADLPPDIPPATPSFTQGLYRYLMVTIAVVWKLTGQISWASLTPMFGAAYALTLLAAFGLFRLGTGKLAALLGTLVLLSSPVHLANLVHFRDYAKAPFILALIFIMAQLALRPPAWRRAMTWAAAFGVVLGIGFGFRNDLLIVIAPWILVILLGVPGSLLSNVRLKGACLALSALMFVVTAFPILRAYGRGSNSGHVALLGMMTTFDEQLGVARPVFDWGYTYNDAMASRLIVSFGEREYGRRVAYLSPEYDRAAAAYLGLIVRHFPADNLARAYGATLAILDDLPFRFGAYINPMPHGMQDAWLLAFYHTDNDVRAWLYGLGAPAVAVALILISTAGVRAAMLALLLLLYFAGYPSIQFHVRHFFHLELITWWAIAFVVERTIIAAARLVRRAIGRRPDGVESRPPLAAARAGAFVLIAVLVIPSGLLIVRWYQTAHLRAWLSHNYLGAERAVIPAVRTATPEGRVLFNVSTIWPADDGTDPISSAYIVAELSPQRCDRRQIPVTFRYQARTPDGDLSVAMTAPLVSGPESTLLFFPAFNDPYFIQFRGVELSARDADCLAAVSRVKPERTPEVLLDAVFTPRWQRGKLYSTLVRFEDADHGDALPAQFSNPAALTIAMRSPLAPFAGPTLAASLVAPTAKAAADGTTVIVGHDTSATTAVTFGRQTFPAGAVIVVKGDLRSGELTLSAVNGAAVSTSVEVTASGPFVAAVAVPDDGVYDVSLLARAKPGWIRTHLGSSIVDVVERVAALRPRHEASVTAFGWMAPDPPRASEGAQ
jgi:hypothetical protein